jgi:arginine decarboxylase
VNYSVQEYANDIIYSLAEACREGEVPMPHVISESGRALTAHHALLLINVIDLETQIVGDVGNPRGGCARARARARRERWRRSTSGNLREVYHDATFAKEQAQQLFNSGVLSLRDRALVERLHLAIMNRSPELAAPTRRSTRRSSPSSTSSSPTATSATSRSSSRCRTPGRSISSSRSCRSTG